MLKRIKLACSTCWLTHSSNIIILVFWCSYSCLPSRTKYFQNGWFVLQKTNSLFACFAIGGGALAAIPFLTIGFFSKDAILGEVWVQGQSIALYNSLYWAGVAGAFLTSIYTFRLIWVVFFGKENTHYHEIKGAYLLEAPLGILAVLSTFVGAALKAPVANILNTAKIPEFHVAEQFVEGMHGAEASSSRYRACWFSCWYWSICICLRLP